MRWLLAMMVLMNSCLAIAQHNDRFMYGDSSVAYSSATVVDVVRDVVELFDDNDVAALMPFGLFVQQSSQALPDSTDHQGDDFLPPMSGDFSDYWWLAVIVLLAVHNVVLRKRNETQRLQQQVLKEQLEQARKALYAAKDQDIDDKAAKLKAAHCEKLATLGSITAGVAHEVNNPNNFVNLSADMLGKELSVVQQYLFELAGEDADPEIIRSFKQKFEPLFAYLDTIKDGTERIKIIVEGLRNYTQQNDDELKVVVVTDLIDATVRLVQSQYKKVVKFTLNYQQSPSVQCYPSKLNQILMNLIVNACHAIEQQGAQNEGFIGSVTIGCEQIQWQKDGQPVKMVEITVADTGCGMTEETKAKLFEPFYTTKGSEKGTGLGLSISADLVAEHHGQLLVESKLNHGTTFILRLPVHFE